jgi:hypothetical protein
MKAVVSNVSEGHTTLKMEKTGFSEALITTVESLLSDLSGTKGRSDNRKCRIIRKTNEKEEGKYQLNL